MQVFIQHFFNDPGINGSVLFEIDEQVLNSYFSTNQVLHIRKIRVCWLRCVEDEEASPFLPVGTKGSEMFCRYSRMLCQNL